MNITEAAISAHWLGTFAICRPIRDRYIMAVQFRPYAKAIAATYRYDCLLSEVSEWAPELSDVLATDWRVFRPKAFAICTVPPEQPIPEPQPEDPEPDVSGPLYRLAVRSEDFRDALRMAGESDVYTAADQLKDMVDQGFPVKTRLKAVQAEINRRERGRKA